MSVADFIRRIMGRQKATPYADVEIEEDESKPCWYEQSVTLTGDFIPYKCSECGKIVFINEQQHIYRYCPWCGKKLGREGRQRRCGEHTCGECTYYRHFSFGNDRGICINTDEYNRVRREYASHTNCEDFKPRDGSEQK